MIIVSTPDPDSPRNISGGDPLAIGRVSCDGSLVSVLAIDGDVKWVVKVEDED
jgi:hypothetical protein